MFGSIVNELLTYFSLSVFNSIDYPLIVLFDVPADKVDDQEQETFHFLHMIEGECFNMKSWAATRILSQGYIERLLYIHHVLCFVHICRMFSDMKTDQLLSAAEVEIYSELFKFDRLLFSKKLPSDLYDCFQTIKSYGKAIKDAVFSKGIYGEIPEAYDPEHNYDVPVSKLALGKKKKIKKDSKEKVVEVSKTMSTIDFDNLDGAIPESAKSVYGDGIWVSKDTAVNQLLSYPDDINLSFMFFSKIAAFDQAKVKAQVGKCIVFSYHFTDLSCVHMCFLYNHIFVEAESNAKKKKGMKKKPSTPYGTPGSSGEDSAEVVVKHVSSSRISQDGKSIVVSLWLVILFLLYNQLILCSNLYLYLFHSRFRKEYEEEGSREED